MTPSLRATVTVHGTLLEVEYTRTDMGDIIISEVWVKHIEMLALLDQGIIDKIRDEVKRHG